MSLTKKTVFFLLWTSLATAVLYFLHITGSQTIARAILPVSFISILVALLHGTTTSVLVGFFAPTASFLATGLPQVDLLLPMVLESVTVGLLAPVFQGKFRNLYLTCVFDFVSAKIVWILAVYLGKSDVKVRVDILSGLVGLGFQLIFIPMVYKILVKSFKIEKQKGGV